MSNEKELKPYLNQSNIISESAIKINSATSMKLITYGLYKLSRNFDIKHYESLDLFNQDNWNQIKWDDFSCKFTTAEFCNNLKLSDSGFLRELIEKAIESAMGEKIKLTNQNETMWIPWFINAVYYHPNTKKMSDSYIKFSFHPGVLSIALGQTKKYTHIDLLNLGKLKSIYSIKWYEIIKSRYNMKGKWGNEPNTWETSSMTISELKELFHIDQKLYQGRNNNLLTKTVKNPIKEINESGFNFTVELSINRGSHNTIKDFKLICKEKANLIKSKKTDSKEKKLIIQEKNDNKILDIEIEKMKKTYPTEWADIEKDIESKSEFPLFSFFVENEIYNKMIEKGYKI